MNADYAACYCEENIWRLLERGDVQDGHAVFVTNNSQSVAVWSQRASPREDGLTLWDYHVVALGIIDGVWHAYDLDSTAGCPIPLPEWIASSFPFAGVLPEDVEPCFRVLTASDLFANFHTDRSHMAGPDGYLAELPPWPRLSDHSNLAEMLDVGRPSPGHIVDIAGLLDRFA